jgi:hypothetical protein
LIEPVFHASVEVFKHVTCVHVISRLESYLFVGRCEDFVPD